MTLPLASPRQKAPASPRFRPDPGLRRAVLLTALTLLGLVVGLLHETRPMPTRGDRVPSNVTVG